VVQHFETQFCYKRIQMPGTGIGLKRFNVSTLPVQRENLTQIEKYCNMKVGFHLEANRQSQDSGQLQKLKTQESKVVEGVGI